MTKAFPMTKARYIGDPRHDGEGPAEVDSCNHHFVKGEWTDVSAEAARRLANNNHFEVDTDDDGEAGPTVDELRAECDARGIQYHARAGVKRLAELLAEAG